MKISDCKLKEMYLLNINDNRLDLDECTEKKQLTIRQKASFKTGLFWFDFLNQKLPFGIVSQ